jgi:predicted ATP-binding protein involved in virulence
MRIDAIKVRNFRGFDVSRWEFNPSINVFVGENGTGKTALLDALAVGAGAYFLGVDGVSARAIARDDVRLEEDAGDDSLAVRSRYPIELEFEGSVFEYPYHWARALTGSASKTTYANAQALSNAVYDHTRRRREGPVETWPLIAYHGTGRLWVQKRSLAATPSKRPRSRLDAYKNCLEAASDEKRFLDWFKAMEWIAFQEKSEPNALRVVRTTLQSLVPGCVDLRYRSKEGELVAVFADGRRLPTRLLSDGFRTVLGLASDLAWRCAALNPHLGERAALETSGVVLIDEIDLHLHPNWQRRIVDDLRRTFPRVQFFMTTHSPFIVQSLRAGEVIPLSGPAHLDVPPYQQGVEDIATGVLGVNDVARSARFLEMKEAAERFVTLLDGQAEGDAQAFEAAKRRYLDLASRYADDPAFLATLEVEGAMRGVRLEEKKPETSR